MFVHGCTDLADDELVLGHAWRPQGRKPLNDRPDIEEIDTRLMEANGIVDGYVSAMFKRSTGIIVQHREFFEALTEIEQVIGLEPSLLAVDAAYFTALIGQRSVAEARRQVACRSPAAPASISV
ncbi:AbiH family protein [Aeromonas sp. ASNIH3]|uniref:AbiH family protein n=1 Tax=Aeromonas sp. ASNIH3 TaxID=1636608 RepID=UPI001F43F332|nr:AbiH family protein [Aeromonas sp. ASNIH3]